MRKIWSKSSKRRSISVPRPDESDVPPPGDDSSQLAAHVRGLVRPDYDLRCTKHSWVNALLNTTSTADFSEASLRLYRVELRGSHLYVFRPPLHLGIRQFRADDVDVQSLVSEPTIQEAADKAAPSASSATASSGATVAASVASDAASIAPTTPGNGAAPPLQEWSHPPVPETPTYFTPLVPHPELHFAIENNAFLPGSSIEALVHFFLFADKSMSVPVRQLISVFPMLPRFGSVLKLMCAYLVAIFEGDFGPFDSSLVVDRIIHLFEHLDQNFSGFLLKSDVAPYMLKMLELFSEYAPASSQDLVPFFRTSMLLKQQILLNLVHTVDSVAATSPSENPLLELNSSVFMNDINLLDLATTITAIDHEFFSKWNSSVDKSLLLYLSVCDTAQGDFFYKKNPLIFNNDSHVHYLSRLLVHHLFVESSAATSEKRARILEKWIDLGCLLDKSGNMSSWLGISSIILSQPVLRLTNVWTYVTQDYIKLLRNDWAPVLFELDRRHLANSYESITFGSSSQSRGEIDSFSASKESYHIMAPRGLGKIYPKERVIPYFGDLLVNNSTSTNIAELETVWRKINYSFDRWNDYLTNLSNSAEIINYNQDVLRRYDSMGFIFSNESLNQVLYLGVNKDDENSVPTSIKNVSEEQLGTEPTEKPAVKSKLRKKLLRLIDLNCDSINLETVMKYSLDLEPTLPENYLKPPTAPEPLGLGLNKLSLFNNSSISIGSGSSVLSGFDNGVERGDALTYAPKSTGEISAEDKLPSFNNHYFKINLHKYDDLVSSSNDGAHPMDEKHNLVVDNELTLRIDDFVTEYEATFASSSGDDPDQPDVDDDGLGIDVDDILNSDKFKNFSIAEASQNTDENTTSGLERKHRSFGLISNSSASAGQPRVQKYIPRFASVDKLIDLLLLDSKYFDESHIIDLTEYRFVFMLNYSSFLSTRDLLEKLAHRFVHSGNAVISVMKKHFLIRNEQFDPATFGLFPKWTVDQDVDLKALGDVDYELLLKIQVNILKALIVLINNFFTNFSNDLRNKKIMIKLLKLYSNEILQWYNSNKIDKDLDKSFESLVNYYKRLKRLFVKKSYKPVEAPKFDDFLTHEFKFSNTMHEVPMNRNLPSHKNVHKIEKFLNKFNKLLTVFYKGITPENWFKTFKVLENLFENYSLLNYNFQKSAVPGVNEDLLVISNIFTYFETLCNSSSKDTVFKKLPLVFRKLFKLYFKFKSYLLIQLCDLNITLEERLDRMKTLLIMIKISKLKMSDSQFVFDGDKEDIPSCIETAITNVIYSPESRTFAHLWLRAGAALNSEQQSSGASRNYESIDALLPTSIKQSDLLLGHEPLLPCFGWIIENLIEVNKCPSFYRNQVNFNKRYLIFKLIKELSVEDPEHNEEIHHDTREFEFLLKLDESLVNLSELKLQVVPEKVNRTLFRGVMKDQYSILANEARKKNLKDHKPASESSQSGLQLVRKTSNTHLRRQSLTYKTNSSSRFKISGLFNKSRTFGQNGTERAVSFKELPDPASVVDIKQKPVHIIQLKDNKIFPIYLLPFCFKIDPDYSSDVCFVQAFSDHDAKDWLKKLSFANRHWFFSRSINARTNCMYTTFGIPLETVCARDKADSPMILDLMYDAIEKEGLKDVGIYRISTSISELGSIKQEIDRTGVIDFAERGVDVHALTSCVKLYFRELPDALLTDDVIELLFQLKRARGESGIFSLEDAHQLRSSLLKLPKVNYQTLKSLVRHLNKVVQQNEHNRMTASNLATVIGPALTEASNLDSLFNNFGVINYSLEKIIENNDVIFEEPGVPLSLLQKVETVVEIDEAAQQPTTNDSIGEEEEGEDGELSELKEYTS